MEFVTFKKNYPNLTKALLMISVEHQLKFKRNNTLISSGAMSKSNLEKLEQTASEMTPADYDILVFYTNEEELNKLKNKYGRGDVDALDVFLNEVFDGMYQRFVYVIPEGYRLVSARPVQ